MFVVCWLVCIGRRLFGSLFVFCRMFYVFFFFMFFRGLSLFVCRL